MVSRPQPPQNPPPVMRVCLRYCKRGRARFASHRDVARALERALRRADVPMAYSSGFNPHPRVSYPGASQTGAATEADYVELGLAREVDPAWLRDALSAALPDGMDVLDVTIRQPEDRTRLTDLLTASVWQVDLTGVSDADLRAAVGALLARESATVERTTGSGVRRFDARGAILELGVQGSGRLVMALRHDAPLVRPDDVVKALCGERPALSGAVPPLFTRLTQGVWRDERIVAPFEADSRAH